MLTYLNNMIRLSPKQIQRATWNLLFWTSSFCNKIFNHLWGQTAVITNGKALSRSHSSARGFFFDWNSATVTTKVFFLFQNNQLLIMICKASFVLHINGNLMQMRSDRYQWYLYSYLKVTRALYSILKCVIGSYTPQVITAIFTRAAFF